MSKIDFSNVDVKKLSIAQLNTLAKRIRETMIDTVSMRGGHLASSLGTVELIIALKRALNQPTDKLIFDVGHQAYAHKLLSPRNVSFTDLRSEDGAAGFLSRSESEYDAFGAGHASTAISAALGYARARDALKQDYCVAAVVGDGALTGGMCYEAMNDAGHTATQLMVILNDNEMSISKNVGALSKTLTRLRRSAGYNETKRGISNALRRIPIAGESVYNFTERIKRGVRSALLPEQFFEQLGFKYFGPIDGHDIAAMEQVFVSGKNMDRPVIVHVITQKGRGFTLAEEQPIAFHGVAPHFLEPKNGYGEGGYVLSGDIVGDTLVQLSRRDARITGITAAMLSGTGLSVLKNAFPGQCFDVGIAEEHAVTLAAGMAAGGLRPYVAIYSTFLQRGYDQIIHDVCLQNLPVKLLIDRAGLVGEDGATHQGVFDLSFLCSMPNMTVLAPCDAMELQCMLKDSVDFNTPLAIRYPRKLPRDLKIFGDGRWRELFKGEVTLLAVGGMVETCLKARELIGDVGVVYCRSVKPMDEGMLHAVSKGRALICVEENLRIGGFGAQVAQWCMDNDVKSRVICLGVPDRFIPHARVERQREMCGLTAEAIKEVVKNL